MNWALLLKEWDRQRLALLKCSPPEMGVFICHVADHINTGSPGLSMVSEVELALMRDRISIDGDGFSDRSWPLHYLRGPEFSSNDRRRAWLVRQVEKDNEP